MYEIAVTHSIDAGHRVVGHEDGRGKCARLHGHTYVFAVTLHGPEVDATGFVTDFAVVKAVLDEWDHRLILRDADPLWRANIHGKDGYLTKESLGIVSVPFNPTAENMARHLAERFLTLDGVERAKVEVSETAKTKAKYTATDSAAFMRRMVDITSDTIGAHRRHALGGEHYS